ncbi:MAG: peptidase, partial [Clostridia bacterium]|nr:peptidase [Clostridia bacterium]
MDPVYVILGIAFVLVVIILANVKIVPQSKAFVIEFLGAYRTTWDTGLHVKIPFIEKISKIVSLKEQVVDFPPQPVITK